MAMRNTISLTSLVLAFALVACGGSAAPTGADPVDAGIAQQQTTVDAGPTGQPDADAGTDPVLAKHESCVVPGATVVTYQFPGQPLTAAADMGPCTAPSASFQQVDRTKTPLHANYRSFRFCSADADCYEFDVADVTTLTSGQAVSIPSADVQLPEIKFETNTNGFDSHVGTGAGTYTFTFDSTAIGQPYTLHTKVTGGPFTFDAYLTSVWH